MQPTDRTTRNELPGSLAFRVVAEVGGSLLSLAFTIGIGAAVMFVARLLGL